MLEALESEMKTKQHFEIVQAYLSLVLKLHGSTIVQNKDLVDRVDRLKDLSANSWVSLQDLFNHGLCLVQLFSDIKS